MNKDKVKKDEIKKGLECCAAVGFETSCNFCPYCYRCNDLSKDALNIITEQEKEIERLTEEHNRHKVVVKDFAEKLKQVICDNTYPYFDKNGKPVNIWNTDGFDKIDELLKEYEK